MGRPKYANKRDGNHSEIQSFLEANGCEVLDCSKVGNVPDLLVKYRNEIACWLELKVPGSKAKWTRPQLTYISGTRFDVAIAKDQQGAIYAIRTREFLSQKQKDNLAGYLLKVEKDFYTPKEIEKVLG